MVRALKGPCLSDAGAPPALRLTMYRAPEQRHGYRTTLRTQRSNITYCARSGDKFFSPRLPAASPVREGLGAAPCRMSVLPSTRSSRQGTTRPIATPARIVEARSGWRPGTPGAREGGGPIIASIRCTRPSSAVSFTRGGRRARAPYRSRPAISRCGHAIPSLRPLSQRRDLLVHVRGLRGERAISSAGDCPIAVALGERTIPWGRR